MAQSLSRVKAISELYQRINLILTRGNIEAQNIALFGAARSTQTPGTLWPSDHAGVAAQLVVEQEERERSHKKYFPAARTPHDVRGLPRRGLAESDLGHKLGEAHLVAGALHAAFQHITHNEDATDFGDGLAGDNF